MAIAVAVEAREGLDDGSDLVADWAEAGPVATAEDADGGTADGGGEVHGAGVVADVEAGGREEGGEERELAVAAEPDGGAGGAGGGDGIGDDDEGVFLVGVAEEHHGEVVRGAQGVDEGGEGGGGPSLDGDVGKTGGKDGGPALVGEIVLGEDVGGGDEGRGRGG